MSDTSTLTKHLSGAALDWAVAKAEGYFDSMLRVVNGTVYGLVEELHFSTDWAQGGPIIERERIEMRTDINGDWQALRAYAGRPAVFCSANTPLVAAMRCYVASKMGDRVDLPNDLYRNIANAAMKEGEK